MNRTEIVEAMARAMHGDGYTSALVDLPPFVSAEYRSQAEAALTAIEARGMVVVPRGLPGEIVAGVIEVAQRAQDFNGHLVSLAARVSEPGNIEIVCDEFTFAMDPIDATRLAALLLRETAMIAAQTKDTGHD